MPKPSTTRQASMRVAAEDPLLLEDLVKKTSWCRKVRTVRWWITRGRTNPFTGKLVFLEYVRLPGGYATSQAALMRFLRELNRQPKPRTSTTKKSA